MQLSIMLSANQHLDTTTGQQGINARWQTKIENED